MGLKDKVFKNKAGDKSKADSPVNDADDVAKEYVKLDAIKQVRQERKEQRHSKESSARSSKGSSIAGQPPDSDKAKEAEQPPTGAKNKKNSQKDSGGGKPSIETDKTKTDRPSIKGQVDTGDEKKGQKKKLSAKFNNEITERASIGNKSVLGASDESIRISIREKYLSDDIKIKHKKRRRWSWGDIFTKRLLNAIRNASRKVFGKRATIDSDSPEDFSNGDARDERRQSSESDDESEVSDTGSHSTKRKKFGFFSRWRQKLLKKTKNKDGDEPRKPRKNYFFFLKRRKRRSVETPAEDNRADSAAMT